MDSVIRVHLDHEVDLVAVKYGGEDIGFAVSLPFIDPVNIIFYDNGISLAFCPCIAQVVFIGNSSPNDTRDDPSRV